ncbi:membrane protein insertase YidC [Citromicrobium sp. RCC1885]|uniref:membrane protein insertase YidC n=1 Tax=unclassified Citromicrobium TaxID=2630544 RepID=UPI0006C9167D|nr:MULTISPECIES: membrane protein insertase YidC [unclassified Citromicrobium]KPM21997.1 membrane protein insertase YidC [Citromicrobium sp. RCC1885]KPM24023.1 membrane protein insertase YidC [Citromicrobium sp. RCC1878]OAM07308.1 membrane protein insertase YidC [Citromicrobium sp. RCC1897]
MDNQRNLILAVVLCGILILGYEAAVTYYYPTPPETDQVDRATTPEQRVAQDTAQNPAIAAAAIDEAVDLDEALSAGNRVAIDAPRVEGSINLVGARIDDIELKDHRATVDKDSGPVQLFAPAGTPIQNFAQFGFVGEGTQVPGADTVWQASGEALTPDTPIDLRWDNAQGQRFRIRLSIDDNYMITAEQTVANTGDAPVVVSPFATITRTSLTASKSTWISHSGPIGTFGGTVDYGPDYDDVVEQKVVSGGADPAWLGFTDIYWLGALIPEAGSAPDTGFRSLGDNLFRADLIYNPATLQPGRQITRTSQLFAGAKESNVLDAYQDAGIAQFGLAIDWGWFRWFEKPILWLLRQIFSVVGNFGVAIILLTCIVRGLMFPIAQKGFSSMASMKAIQPEMKKLQEKHKDDKVTQQQEMQKLFKERGVNPVAGCLPMLLQIPVFFALYKVLILAIEMRHQPFIFWIRDLSAPDPAHILNLFGMLPFEVPGMLALGPLALLLGFTMWLTFRLNPAAMDPVQQQVFSIMPWVMMFVMSPFAAGLLLYWNTSNILTLAQQKYLYSKHPQLREAAEKERAEKAAKAQSESKA